MARKLNTLLIASLMVLQSATSIAFAQEKSNNAEAIANYSSLYNPWAWMTMQGAAPAGQGMNPFVPMLSPYNWVNPNAYMAFMNPQNWGAMMNPMTYMPFMNPAMYAQMMNPASYMSFMNPATYAQAMDPNSYMAGMMQMFAMIQNEEVIPTDFWELINKQMQAATESMQAKQ